MQKATQLNAYELLVLTEIRQWSKVNIPGNSPCPRRRHCCCLLNDKAVLFGGTRWAVFHCISLLQCFFKYGRSKLANVCSVISPTPGALVEDDYSLRDHSDLFILDLSKSCCETQKLTLPSA